MSDVGVVVAALHGLDVVHEHLVDHGLAGGGDRPEEVGGARRRRARHRRCPRARASASRTRSRLAASMPSRNAGRSSSGLPTPQSPQSRIVSAPGVPRTLPGWKSPWTRVSGRPQASIAANRPGGRRRARRASPRPPPARSTERRWTVSAMRAVSPGPRQSGRPMRRRSSTRPIHDAWIVDQHRHHREQLGLRRRRTGPRPAMSASRTRSPSWPSSCGTALALEPAEHVALVGEERRHDLEPGRSAARERQPPDARQVPAPDLLGRPVALDPAREQHLLGPSQIRVRAARLRPAEAERLVVELDVEREQRLGRERRPGDRGRDLGEVRHRRRRAAAGARCRASAARRRRGRTPPAPPRRPRSCPATTGSRPGPRAGARSASRRA